MNLKNNKLLCILLFMATMLLNINKVYAVNGAYNGGGSMSLPSGTGVCPSSTSNSNLCFYNNANHATIRITLVKYQDGKRTQVGNSIYYTASKAAYTISEVNATSITGSAKKESTKGKIYTGDWYHSNYVISPTKMEQYLYKKGETVRNNAIGILKQITDNANFQSKEALSKYLTELIKKGDKREFRLVIEPVFSFSNGSSIVYYTAKAIAKSGKSLTRSGRWCEIGSKLYTEYKDIGIAKGSYQGSVDSCSSYTNTIKTLVNHANGTGYNIASFIDYSTIKLDHLVCDYYKSNHFKRNINGEKKPTDKVGSGPIGENCCNLSVKGSNGKTNLTIYKEQYKEEFGKTPTTSAFKKFFYELHPECIEPTEDNKPPIIRKGSCYGSGETDYDQSASEYDLLAAIGQEKGQTNINGSTSNYLRKNIGSRGKIVCSESVKLSLPINYQNKLYRGSILEWPTYNSGLRLNTYPLNMEGTASCILNIDYSGIVSDNTIKRTCTGCSGAGQFRTCYSYDCSYVLWDAVAATVSSIQNSAMDWKKNPVNYYDLKGNFYVKYNDARYGGTFPLVRYFDGHKNYKTTGFSFGNTGGSFTINQQVKYKINQNQYRYILKLDNQETLSTNSLPGGIGKNYIDVGYGNLPIATDAKEGKYNISILYNQIGGFSNYKFSPTTTSYNCSYEVDVDTPIPSYQCPSNTQYAGKDLTACMSGGCDGKKYTYQEAIGKFCGGGDNTPDTSMCVCPEGTENCGMDLSVYTAAGMTCSQAQSKYCNNPNPFPNPCPSGTDFEGLYILTDSCNNDYNCKMLTCNQYVCPENTKKAGMSCDALVADYIARNGGTINTTLLNKLYKKFCGGNTTDEDDGTDPGSGNKGINIIYRVIELNDPFPGKSGSGREPGYNWNNVKTIKNYITNNRNVQTNKVYNKNNVMYHFKLTPSIIKTIRSYNSNNDYSNFNLTCKATSGRECISDFVHDSSYGLQGDSKCFANGSFSKCRN